MGKHLQVDLEQIEHALSDQMSIVEQMVDVAWSGLEQRHDDPLPRVAALENRLDQSEVSVEEQCLRVLALLQPVAIDLRRVTAVLKINSDLERIGDLALNLAERSRSLAEYPSVPLPAKLSHMATLAQEMLRDAHTCFLKIDATLAADVRRRDNDLNELNRQVIAQLTEAMRSEPDQAEAYLHMFSTSRLLEHIGDHATSIAEDVIYLANGSITRHRQRSA